MSKLNHGDLSWEEMAEFKHKIDIMNRLKSGEEDHEHKRTHRETSQNHHEDNKKIPAHQPHGASISKEDFVRVVNSHQSNMFLPPTMSYHSK